MISNGQMQASEALIIVLGYFAVLILISFLTSRKSTNETFFNADKSSPWYLVAFGMIGASLSGVTFISIPGWVNEQNFAYMQVALGYVIGYFVIAYVLMPLYYRLKLTTIYTYLEDRFGFYTYQTGSWFFILSRVIGASFRMYLVANVLHFIIVEQNGIDFPFAGTVALSIAMIWVYTFKGGIKTVVWTDTLQTLFMLLALGICFYLIAEKLGWTSFGEAVTAISDSSYSRIFVFDDINSPYHFAKQFLSGIFIAIVMTGLDQDMMQKNLTCKNLREAQKNMISFSTVLVFVNLAFLALGAVLYMYVDQEGIALSEGDNLFAMIASTKLGLFAGAVFLIGVVAAAYSSADSALTSLTTSFSIDIMGHGKRRTVTPLVRNFIHLGFSVVLFGAILLFRAINDRSVVNALFTAAGYTYGPLLGLFSFGMFMKRKPQDRLVPIVCVVSPLVCYFISMNSVEWWGYTFGFELLILNGLLTFLGLLALPVKDSEVTSNT